MKVQCITNYDYQRKQDVNFKAILAKRNAFNLLDALFQGKFQSVRDLTFHLGPKTEKAKFSDLYITAKEAEGLRMLDCEKGDFTKLGNYLTALSKKAGKSGTYTVRRIRKAIREGTLFADSNFATNSATDEAMYQGLQAKAQGFCSHRIIKGIVRRVVSVIVDRPVKFASEEI